MKNFTSLLLLGCILLSSCQENKSKEKKENTIKKKEWISLFDGKTLNGWHQYNGSAIGEAWSVVDSTLVFDPSKKRNGGDKNMDNPTSQVPKFKFSTTNVILMR